MKILVIQTPEYDFCSATLIEGLHCLIEEGQDIELVTSEYGNYGQTNQWNYCVDDEAKLIKCGNEADIVVVTSNRNVKEFLVQDSWKDKLVFIDGEDTYPNIKDPSNYVLYFLREMRLSEYHADNVRPFPFGIERRYYQCMPHNFSEAELSKDIPVSCMFGPHDDMKPWRRWIESTLMENEKEGWVVGQNYGGNRSHFNQVEVNTGDRDHFNYYNVLARSKITIDGYGAYGCNAARFWEGLANGCLVFTQPLLIHMPPSDSGCYFIQFSDKADLMIRLEYYLKHPRLLSILAKRGFEYGKKFHTTKARAQYFLRECKEIGLV